MCIQEEGKNKFQGPENLRGFPSASNQFWNKESYDLFF